MQQPVSSSTRWWYAGIGVTAAIVGLLAGTAVALADLTYAPLNAVASAAIDAPGATVKTWATETFGTAAKSVVVFAAVVVILAIAAWLGALARTRRWLSIAAFVLAGFVGATAAWLRPTAELPAVVPSLLAGIVAALVVWFLTSLVLSVSTLPERDDENPERAPIQRRRVLIAGAGLLGVGAAALAVSRVVAAQRVAEISRSITALPQKFRGLAPLPASVQAPVEGMPPFITPNNDFYVIDTGLVKPAVSAEDWTLSIGGMVNAPFTLSFAELLEMPMAEYDITLMCVSNPIGGEYISNARWLGTPLMPLLERAGVDPGADQLFSTSVDGWTCSTPLSGLAERTPILAIGMNGEPLPVAHGYPVRMVIPGLYGFISATKWLAKIDAATYADMPAYWTQRGWATDAPVLTGSKIEVPFGTITPGVHPIAGSAWAMDGGGISKVEVQIDDGEWLTANLADAPATTTWRQWWLPVEFQPGDHTMAVRATNGDGVLQTAELRDVVPSGATGYDVQRVTVSS